MKKENILKTIEEIRDCQDDPEVAHVKEDTLYVNFIESLKTRDDTSQELKELAALVLTTKDISFPRWCS